MTKKILVCLLLCVALCLGMGLSASAATIDYVTDAAGILSETDRLQLAEQARTVSEFYECGVYVVVVDDYKNYVHGSMEDFSETVYKSYELGLGEAKNGILLALSMAERDYDLCAYGDWAHYAFTDYGKGELADTFLDDFRNNDWREGFDDYIANCITLMDMAKNGNPLDTIVYDEVPEVPGWDAFELMLIVLIPSVIAFAVCSVFRMQMRNTGRKSYAKGYVRFTFGDLSIEENRLINRSVQRIPIMRGDDDDGFRPSGGRPGGTSINVGGFSHKSGKF